LARVDSSVTRLSPCNTDQTFEITSRTPHLVLGYLRQFCAAQDASHCKTLLSLPFEFSFVVVVCRTTSSCDTKSGKQTADTINKETNKNPNLLSQS